MPSSIADQGCRQRFSKFQIPSSSSRRCHHRHRVDVSLKLAGYFRLPSVAHYLIVDPMQPMILHHSRGSGDAIITRVVTAGSIALDPPGLELALSDIYGA